MSETVEAKLHRIDASVCDLCLNGAGGECHTPGCAFWIFDAPLASETGPLHFLTSFTESAADVVTSHEPVTS